MPDTIITSEPKEKKEKNKLIEGITDFINKFQPKKSEDIKRIEEEWKVNNIEFLIVNSKDEYIVFLDNDLDIDWATSDEYDQNNEKTKKQRGSVLTKISYYENIPTNVKEKDILLSYKRMLGQALVSAFNNDFIAANELLKKADEYINLKNIEQSYMWYYRFGIFKLFTCLFIQMTLWLFRQKFIKLFGVDIFYYLLCGLTGASGAFISMIFRKDKIFLNSSSDKKLHKLESSCRIIVGVILGIISIIFMNLNILNVPFLSSGNNYLCMHAIAFFSGYSERAMSSIMKNIEDVQLKERRNENEKKSADNI